ncbi:hypothetical protein HAX54_015806, partial [Datura stramonium]|nr:hypothetical protein [Datura stramonium]
GACAEAQHVKDKSFGAIENEMIIAAMDQSQREMSMPLVGSTLPVRDTSITILELKKGITPLPFPAA